MKRISFPFFLLLLGAQPGVAVTPVVLIGPDLKPRAVNLQAFGGSKVTYFDAERRLQIEPTGDILQIRFPASPCDDDAPKSGADANSDDDNAAGKRAMVELTDGQRLVGRWLGADETGEKIQLQSAVLGGIQVSLDRMRSLSIGGEAPASAAATPASDEVLLVNDDVIRGFVVSVTAKEVEVQPNGAAQAIKLPADRVKTVRLANPPVRPKGRSHLVWLHDGSRLRGTDLTIEADALRIKSQLTATEKKVSLKRVARIELASLAGRLVDLTDLPRAVTGGGNVFGLTTQVRQDGARLHLHAPVTVRFDLPPRARRFAAVAELDDNGDVDSRWADFLLLVRQSGEVAARVHVSNKSRIHAINIAVDGDALEIELDPAANGPVLDRLRLREAMLFVESATD